MKKLTALPLAVCLATVMLLSMSTIATAKTFSITIAAGLQPISPWVRMIDERFIPEVDKLLAQAGGKYKIKWKRAYGGTVAKVGGVLEAVEQGIADMGFVGAVFEPANLPLQNVTYYTPFATTDIVTAVEVVDELHYKIPAMMKTWDNFNQVYLTGCGVGNFDLYTKKPVKSIKDLQGIKIGGAGPNLNWLRGTGVTGVQIDLTTLYNDLATGIYDGVLLPAALAATIKLNEVTPYCLAVGFGAMSTSALVVNKDFWNTLPKEVHAIFKKAARVYRDDLNQFQVKLRKKGLKMMQKGGLKIIELSESERVAWANAMPDIAGEWAKKLEAKGLPAKQVIKMWLDGVKAKGSKPVRNWGGK